MATWMALAVFGVTATFCSIVDMLVRDMLIEDFNNAAVDQLQSVSNAVKVWADGYVYVELNPVLVAGFSGGSGRGFVVRNVQNRELIAQSMSLDEKNTTLLGLPNANRDVPTFGRGIAPNGADAVIVTQIVPAQWDWDLNIPSTEVSLDVRNTVVEITLAIDRMPLAKRLRNLGFLTLSIAIGAATAAAIAGFVTVKFVLHPLDVMTNRAARIYEPTYDRPFPTDGPEELRPIAGRLNDLLARLADASLVERRFTAEAAHELRTPIAELRTLTDVALRFPTAQEQHAHVIKSSNDIAVRLSSLIDALLGIARKDVTASTLHKEPVDPPEILRRVIADLDKQAKLREMDVTLRVDGEYKIMSDETLLVSIFTNLIGNAINHAPRGTAVGVCYTMDDEGLLAVVSNPAPDMEPADIENVFVPFWRKHGRSSEQDHSGLGLALSKGFADVLGFKLSAQLTEQKDFTVTLRSRNV